VTQPIYDLINELFEMQDGRGVRKSLMLVVSKMIDGKVNKMLKDGVGNSIASEDAVVGWVDWITAVGAATFFVSQGILFIHSSIFITQYQHYDANL
jgi:hypothetical protein